jgi:hypothetical protein
MLLEYIFINSIYLSIDNYRVLDFGSDKIYFFFNSLFLHKINYSTLVRAADLEGVTTYPGV